MVVGSGAVLAGAGRKGAQVASVRGRTTQELHPDEPAPLGLLRGESARVNSWVVGWQSINATTPCKAVIMRRSRSLPLTHHYDK